MRLSPLQVMVKAKYFLLEVAQHQSYKVNHLLQPEEKKWLSPFVPSPSKHLLSPLSVNLEWRIRDEDDKFQTWWRSKNTTTIFFDGASKGNPGEAGAGGVIYSPNGNKVYFSWGLGMKSNNQAELLGLTKACLIAREEGIKDLQVFGDSEIIIKNLISKSRFSNSSLNKTLDRLNRVLLGFNSCKFYHVLRLSNREADQLANKGSTLMKGLLMVNNESFFQIP
jgi:ribonuclease HI